jgi:hypothetical protein
MTIVRRITLRLQLTHIYDNRLKLTYGDTPLFDYVYNSQAVPFESPRPYFHPMYSLAGDNVTVFRPYDHLWHVGLSMTWTYINDQNFWGGNTYVHGQGYIPLNNVGRTQHIAWKQLECQPQQALFTHQLAWITSYGETWLSEERHIAVNLQHAEAGIWTLDFTMQFRNVSDKQLEVGSPVTHGRPLAGYGGLFWRGPRSFLNGKFFAAGGQQGEAIVSNPNVWVAYSGKHDGSNRASTIIFVDDAQNQRYPTKWWGRDEPYACISSSFVYDEPFIFKPGQELALKYRVLLCNGEYDMEAVNNVIKQVG